MHEIPVVVARYDDLADWYDEQFSTWQRGVVPHLSRLLGPSDGVCLDIACGTGFLGQAVAPSGREVVGVDISAGQLRLARTRMAVLRGDAVRLPFGDATFATVMCTYLHTDIDDMGPVFAEAARTLRPAGRFVYIGLYPCFKGHHAASRHDGTRIIYPNYADARWHRDSPRFGTGLRRRVGYRHVTLAELLNAVLAESHLRLQHVEEIYDDDRMPGGLALVASRASPSHGPRDSRGPRERTDS
jgi:SAM-dependent methyltransferase